ncbi:MAG: MarR family winged helix-turn-helix transcriptional regulator [Planctomycetota bacterium]|jgi:DNA-binding MarR family transcriptional regulator
MPPALSRQAQRLYQTFAELIRGYQFRDREGICCHGLSVSQCYTLEALEAQGPATMGELAGRLFLEVSSMTRIVDHLVANKLAKRSEDPRDRRVCRVQITRQGRALASRIRGELIKEHELMLREIPAESREAVISAMSHLLSAFKQRQQRRCEAA